jgi:aryl-alcohol dehydrogenase-like predicted oxidoreductase
MHQRTFGSSNFPVSEVGIGTWQLGGQWGQEVPEAQALETLAAAYDAGVTFFDTADIYGLGRSETLIGKFVKQSRAKLFIATKLGRSPDPGWPDNFTAPVVRRHVEGSLKRLGVEALDLEQLHCMPLEELKRGEMFEALSALKREGKIRAFGASVESIEEALVCLDNPELSSLQIIFNIFRQKLIPAFFERAKRQGVALIVRLPLASGLLSGKFTKDSKFDPADHRNFNRDGEKFNVGETFAGLPFEKGVELADGLKAMLPPGMTLAQMALRWCIDFDAVTTLIPGAKNPRQARENAAASDLPPLSPELHRRLSDYYDRQVAAHIRGAY